MSAFFDVCVKGFRGLMTAKPKWHFVRELISNSLDESSVNNIKLELIKESRFVTIICKDDGAGFERLSDAYTLFAHTKKRSNALVRGRFNMGEKELASISKFMSIETTSGKVVFKDGKRSTHPRIKLDRGTIVTAKIRCSISEFEEIVSTLGYFIIPNDMKVTVEINNGSELPIFDTIDPVDTDWEISETLETILFDEETGGMRPTRRKTQVDIHKTNKFRGNKTFLYELGIPVQEIDCKYSVNVNQKIPMNANRDSVKDSYLRDIYALVLNATHGDLDVNDISESWVRTASEDELVTDDAFTSVKNARYGEKSVKWSTDLQANEDARNQGYSIIHPRSMSRIERSRMEGVGLVSASVQFKRPRVGYESINRNNWTDSMKQFEKNAFQICDMLRISRVKVKYIVSVEASTIADYGSHRIRFNLGHHHWGSTQKARLNFDPMSIKNLDIFMHELGHMGSSYDYAHDRGFYDMLTRHSAKFVLMALINKDNK